MIDHSHCVSGRAYFQRVDSPSMGTVGLQDGTGRLGLTIASDELGILHAGLAVRAVPTAPWLTVAPMSGIAVGGGASALIVNADAAGLAYGAHAATILIASDACDRPSISIPVRFQVVAPEPFVVLVSQDSADAGLGAVGDGDGFCEPGERVALVPSFRNEGVVPASGVTATLASSSSAVSVAGGSIPVGAIAAGATVIAPPALVDIAPSCPDDTTVALTWTMTDGVRTWMSPATVSVTRRSRLSGIVTQGRSKFDPVIVPTACSGWIWTWPSVALEAMHAYRRHALLAVDHRPPSDGTR